jgi:hypothetical protein
MPERIVYHRAGSAAKAEAIIEHGFDRTSGDQYCVGLWTCSDPEMWKGGPVQFKLRATYEREAYWDEVPEAGRAWTGNPEEVDNVYEAKGIDVVRRGENRLPNSRAAKDRDHRLPDARARRGAMASVRRE